MRLDQLLSELGSHERPRVGPWFRWPRPRRCSVAQPSTGRPTRGNRCTEPDGRARQILQLPRAKRVGWDTPSGGFGLYTPPCSTGSTPTNTFCAVPPAHRCDTRSGRNCQPVNSRSCDSSRPSTQTSGAKPSAQGRSSMRSSWGHRFSFQYGVRRCSTSAILYRPSPASMRMRRRSGPVPRQ